VQLCCSFGLIPVLPEWFTDHENDLINKLGSQMLQRMTSDALIFVSDSTDEVQMAFVPCGMFLVRLSHSMKVYTLRRKELAFSGQSA